MYISFYRPIWKLLVPVLRIKEIIYWAVKKTLIALATINTEHLNAEHYVYDTQINEVYEGKIITCIYDTNKFTS